MRSIALNDVSSEALGDAAEHGETVVVTRDGVPIGQFVPEPSRGTEPTTVAERLAQLDREHPPDPEFGDHLEKIYRELRDPKDNGVREWLWDDK